MILVAVVLAVAAGLAGAVQAAVMGELGERVGVFPALAFSGVVSVVFGVVALLVVKQSLRGVADVAREGYDKPTTSSKRTGTRVSSRPVASRSAERIAAVETTVGGSPTPFTP